MALTTIADLTNESPEMILYYTSLARRLKGDYDEFIRNDDDDASFEVQFRSSIHRAEGAHASEISLDGCPRQVVYSMIGVEKQQKIDPFWKKRFRVGHAIHAMLQNDFERMSEKTGGLLSYEAEVPISPQWQEVAKRLGIHSHCDGVFSFREKPAGPVVLRVATEIKTDSPKEFENRKEPSRFHLDQGTIYMACLDIPLLWFVYYNKGNQNMVPSSEPFLIRFDHRRWQKLQAIIKERWEDAEALRLPDRKEGIKCCFCSYAHFCKPAYLVQKEK